MSDEVRERRAVLERHRGVDVVEAAAVGPELLDELLRGDRAEGEGLRSAGERPERLAARERLDDALRDEEQGADHADRQQDVEDRAREVGPEVAERRAVARARSPRTTAMSTAMPTAAEAKFCTASPAICVKFVIVVSPP